MSQKKTTQSDFESAIKKYRTGMQIILEGAKADTGQTPKEVIWTKNKAKLYHYEPKVEKRYPVPILMIYALINRPYVLDLMPGNSLVEYLVGKGFDVFMLDWGTPGDEDKKTFIRRLCFRLYITRREEGTQSISRGGNLPVGVLYGWNDDCHVRRAFPR